MLNVHDSFFLGRNVNEPVAIEIPVRIKDPRDLGNFLTNLGFEITYDGFEKGKILIDTTRCNEEENVVTYSIITPALKPHERAQFYSVLKDAIEEYIKICTERGDMFHYSRGLDKKPNMLYPHLLDLKQLVADTDNIGRDENRGNEIERILDELEKSGKVHQIKPEELNFYGPLGTPNNTEPENYFHGDTAELFPRGYLYNGSAISDPYGVSTGFNSRFIRFATTNPKYAVSLAGVDHVKSICGYRNISPKGGRYIGFVYQYEYNRSNQLMFGNAGIEREQESTGYEPFDNETAVTRFDNPCVGIYLMWADVNNPEHYYVYRIDENDPRYQIIKDYYKPANPNLHDSKRARFQIWNNEGENHETYMPVKDGNLEQTKTNVDAMIAKRKADAERLDTLQTDINKISAQISSIVFGDLRISGPVNKTNIFYVLENNDVIAKAEQKGKDILAILNEIKQQLDALRAEVENNEKLKAKYMSQIEQKEKNWKEKIDECNECLTNLSSYKEKNKGYIKSIIEDFIEPDFIVKHEIYRNASLEIRKDILKVFLEHVQNFNKKSQLSILPERLLNLYIYAPKEQKSEIFDLFYQIRMKAPRDFRKAVKNQLKSMGGSNEDLEILTELFSRDNIFIKHTEKARKLMALRMGTANVKRKMEEMANARQAIAENDSRDM